MRYLLTPVLAGALSVLLPGQRVTVTASIDYQTPSVKFTYVLWGEPGQTGLLFFAAAAARPIDTSQVAGWHGLLYLDIERLWEPAQHMLWLDDIGAASYRTAAAIPAVQGAYFESQSGLWVTTDNYVLADAWLGGANRVLAATYNSESLQLRVRGRYQPGTDLVVYGRRNANERWNQLYTIDGALSGSVDWALERYIPPGYSIEVRAGAAVLLNLQ